MPSETIRTSISEAYGEYKSATHYFLTWLRCQYRLVAPTHERKMDDFQSTKDILNAVRVVSDAESAVPASVISSLRNAIAKRREVLAIYKRLCADDLEHEVFLRKLEKALRVLKPFVVTSNPTIAEREAIKNFIAPNKFFALNVVDEDIGDDQDTAPSSQDPPQQSDAQVIPPSAPTDEKKKPTEFSLEDDKLGAKIEVMLVFVFFKNLSSLVQSYYTDAANGMIPLPLAAWLTNSAYYHVQPILTANRLACSSQWAKCWGLACEFFTKSPDALGRNERVPECFRFLSIAQAVWKYRESKKSPNHLKGVSTIDPLAHLPSTGSLMRQSGVDRDSIAVDRNLVHVIMSNMERVFNYDGAESLKRELSSEPPWDENSIPDDQKLGYTIYKSIARSYKYELMHPKNIKPSKRMMQFLEYGMKFYGHKPRRYPCEPIFYIASIYNGDSINEQGAHMRPPTELVFGIDMLLETYDAFLHPGGELKPQDARLTSLRLAMEMKAAADSLKDTLASTFAGLNNYVQKLQVLFHFSLSLDNYVKEKLWDVYHRAPWTAGCHMVQLLHHAHIFGNILCFDLEMVPAALHLYNAMVRSEVGAPRVPIMEELCDLFEDNVFGGKRPNRNFVSHYRRVVYGSKISKERPGEGGRDFGSRLEGSSKESKVRLKHVESVFFQQHHDDHPLSLQFVAHINGVSDKQLKHPKTRESFMETSSRQSPVEMLEKMKTAVLAEFEGPRPVARINYFAILGVCCKILEDMSEAHGLWRDTRGAGDASFKSGLARELTLVEDALRYCVESSMEKSSERMMSRRPVQAARIALENVDKKAKLSQFLWNV
ncbi:hypothetical protein CkaCkLH20_00944 [Colletotrichum karsti]|uniref:DUF6604 domain-containing protein n=1 Tax=Colletotrichum karsti TaxID=1095194 RepID=A0A9P6IE02_9PEZI|nr:uncharacterized protein CkaCkLH20_00944 [Colletotrichum karsti]KAF9881798.1 hypothetical protein CkaCkLH20_00944 [Colletotrichum karsti]